jgi:hypothetical protein
MPGAKSKHVAKWDRCIKKVKEKSPNTNPYAICSASIEDAGLKKQHQKRSKEGYYANRKKAARKSVKEGMITNFEDFLNEDLYNDEEMIAKMRQEQEETEYYDKAKELYDEFVEEHDLDIAYDITYVKDWLEDRDEPEIFAEFIFNELLKAFGPTYGK